MKAYKIFFLFVLVSMSNSALAEYLYFSCLTKIGSVVLKMDNHGLEYYLNENGKLKFSFKSKKDMNNDFTYNHYSRFQTDYFNVSFINDDYKYSVFSNYEGGQQSRGVTVFNLNSKKEFTYHCQKTDIDRLSDLSSKLQSGRDHEKDLYDNHLSCFS